MENEKKTGSGWIPVLEILAAGCGWGTVGLFTRKLLSAGISEMQVTFIRAFLALLLLGAVMLKKDRNLFRIRLRDIWMFLGSGMVSFAAMNVFSFLALQRATMAETSILLYTAPFFVVLLSAVLFRERITFRKVSALFLAFCGCILVSGMTGGGMSPEAAAFGILSGISYAFYSIFTGIALRRYESLTVVFYTFLSAAAGLLPFSGGIGLASVLIGSAKLLLSAICIGVLCSAVPYLLYADGMRKMETGKAAVLAYSEPLVAAITGILLFGETLHLKNAAGMLLIFIAIAVLNLPMGERKEKG